MSDFSKVHGPGHDPKSLFARENAELRAQNQVLNSELISRAAPALSNWLDALNNLTARARAGDPAAKALLGHVVRAVDNAREAASSHRHRQERLLTRSP